MISDINELVPAMRPKVEKLISEAAKLGYKLRIVETYRTRERQAQLYAQGRTTPGAIVTNAKPGTSYHEKRRAVDLVDQKKGYNINWEIIGQIGTKQGLVWGGTFGDKPHFEYHGEENVTQDEISRVKIDTLEEFLLNRPLDEGDVSAIEGRSKMLTDSLNRGNPINVALNERVEDIVRNAQGGDRDRLRALFTHLLSMIP